MTGATAGFTSLSAVVQGVGLGVDTRHRRGLGIEARRGCGLGLTQCRRVPGGKTRRRPGLGLRRVPL